MQGTTTKDAYEGDQGLAMPKYTFWDIDFKMVILKKQKNQGKPLTFPWEEFR